MESDMESDMDKVCYLTDLLPTSTDTVIIPQPNSAICAHVGIPSLKCGNVNARIRCNQVTVVTIHSQVEGRAAR